MGLTSTPRIRPHLRKEWREEKTMGRKIAGSEWWCLSCGMVRWEWDEDMVSLCDCQACLSRRFWESSWWYDDHLPIWCIIQLLTSNVAKKPTTAGRCYCQAFVDLLLGLLSRTFSSSPSSSSSSSSFPSCRSWFSSCFCFLFYFIGFAVVVTIPFRRMEISKKISVSKIRYSFQQPSLPGKLLVKSLCVFSWNPKSPKSPVLAAKTPSLGGRQSSFPPLKSPVWGVSDIFRPDQPIIPMKLVQWNYSNEIPHVFSSVAFLWLSRPPTPWSSDRAASHHRNLQTNGAANGRIVVLDGLARDLGMGQHLLMWVKQCHKTS